VELVRCDPWRWSHAVRGGRLVQCDRGGGAGAVCGGGAGVVCGRGAGVVRSSRFVLRGAVTQ
jgi:hypothetical protein